MLQQQDACIETNNNLAKLFPLGAMTFCYCCDHAEYGIKNLRYHGFLNNTTQRWSVHMGHERTEERCDKVSPLESGKLAGSFFRTLDSDLLGENKNRATNGCCT